jgi:tRNA (guanine37-N1)-methyltransferase
VFIVLTLFPEMLKAALSASILGRAIKSGPLTVLIKDIRDFSTDKHKTVDDKPYGGGAGMVLKVDVLDRAISWAKEQAGSSRTILLTPRGKIFNQSLAQEFAHFLTQKAGRKPKALILLAGHYEGYDERIRNFIDQEISIGEYILTGGELPALVIIETVARLLPNVLPKKDSYLNDSFSLTDPETKEILLEYPQYTRPPVYKGLKVPEVLLSGDHQKIAQWRLEEARRITKIYKSSQRKA